MDHTLNLKHQTMKFLEDHRRENLADSGYGNNFLYITPKAQSVKEIIDKLNFIKTKNCSARDGE